MLMLCTMDIPKAQDQRLILRFKLFSLLQILELLFCIIIFVRDNRQATSKVMIRLRTQLTSLSLIRHMVIMTRVRAVAKSLTVTAPLMLSGAFNEYF